MKYNILVCLLFLLGSCSDFLDRNPIDQVGEDGFYKNTEEVNKGVIACYNGILEPFRKEWFLTEIRSDNTRHSLGNSGIETAKNIYHLDVLNPTTTNTPVKEYWDAVYANIYNCNKVISSLGAVDNAELRKQYEGEALFIRSMHYFNLVRLFGPLFLTTETMTVEEALRYERSSIETVYTQIIYNLEKVVGTDEQTAFLPTTYKDTEKGRADIWAAKTLLAKVYLTRKEYNKAHSLLLDVYTNSGYGDSSLSYANIFDITNELNKEIIFAARYQTGAYGIGSPFAKYFAPSGESSHITGNGNGFNAPTEDLLASYEKQEGSDEYDKRREACFKTSWFQKSDGKEVFTSSTIKYFYEDITLNNNGENDWPVLRFADVVLMLGEVENELNGPTAGLPYINEIRRRAGIRVLTTADVATKTQYRLAMENERRWEFASENHRLFDLIRTERALAVLNSHLATETICDASTGTHGLLYMNPTETYPDLKLTNSDKYPIQENKLLLPIPNSIMTVAPNATQNPGY